MFFSFELLLEAVLFGILLGCFYAALSIGLSVSFGLLDVPHVAHPAVMIFGSYCTYVLVRQGLDPIVAGLVLTVPFFFLGLALIIEVGLILGFGVDQRLVEAPYIGQSLKFGETRVPMRMLVAFAV